MSYWLVSFSVESSYQDRSAQKGGGVFQLDSQSFLPGAVTEAIKQKIGTHFKKWVTGRDVKFFVTILSVTEITAEGFADFIKPDISKVEVESITWR